MLKRLLAIAMSSSGASRLITRRAAAPLATLPVSCVARPCRMAPLSPLRPRLCTRCLRVLLRSEPRSPQSPARHRDRGSESMSISMHGACAVWGRCRVVRTLPPLHA